LAEAGKDATGPFDDVSHSDDAKKLVTEMLVGTFVGGEVSSFVLVIVEEGLAA